VDTAREGLVNKYIVGIEYTRRCSVSTVHLCPKWLEFKEGFEEIRVQSGSGSFTFAGAQNRYISTIQ
jgi:hypothetical protein